MINLYHQSEIYEFEKIKLKKLVLALFAITVATIVSSIRLLVCLTLSLRPSVNEDFLSNSYLYTFHED